MKKIFLFLLVLLILSFVKADTISVNPGGEQTGISPNPYIQSAGPSAFGCFPVTCAGTRANCGTWTDGCGGIIDCGTCSSGYSCSSGICTIAGGTTPGGGTAPPSGGIPKQNISIVIVPTDINLKMAVNTSSKQIIKITNNGNSVQTFSISQDNLTDMLIIKNTTLTVAPGETKNLEVIFVSSEDTGIFTGKINIGNYKILVNLNIQTKVLLFDSNIIVLNHGYKVSENGKLKTKITLVPMGDKERMDVRLNYNIEDSNGKVYLTHSETVLIEDRMDLYRDFDVMGFPLGKYVINLELIYPNGIAPSNAQFEIIKQTAQDFLSFVMFTLIVAMIIVSIVIVALSIISRKKKE